MSRPEPESFPRRPLSFRSTRRELFRSVRSEWARLARSEPGRPAYRLASLGAVSDERLGEIVPVLVPGTRLTVDDGAYWSRAADPDATPRRLFPADRAGRFVVESIDGRTSLRGIAEAMESRRPELAGDSFALVRGVFLVLVRERLAVPV